MRVVDSAAGYRLLLVSAVGRRDGMALEPADDDGEQVAEVFEDVKTKRRTFTQYAQGPVSVEAIECLLDRARRDL